VDIASYGIDPTKYVYYKEIIRDVNNLLISTCKYVSFWFKSIDLVLCTFTHCLGGVGITFACNGSITVDCRGLPAPSLSTVSEIWPI